MTSARYFLKGLLVAGLVSAAGACGSDGKADTFTPGDYAYGVVIDGFMPVSLDEPPFEGYPELYGFGDLNVADDGTITGSLEIDYTPKDDGPGDYDIEGLAEGNTFTFTAGDYEGEGIFTEDGTMEGELTGPDGQEGIFFAIPGDASDMLVACGGMNWYIDTLVPASGVSPRPSYEYSGYSPGIVFFSPEDEAYAGFFAGQNASGSFEGSVTFDGAEGDTDIFASDGADLLFSFNPDEDTTSVIEGEDRDGYFGMNYDTGDDALYFNVGFAGENDDFSLFYPFFQAHTSNCPGVVAP